MDENIIYDEFNNKITSLENTLIDIRQGNTSHEVIDEMFRAVHTIKATADMLFLFDLVTLTHKSEDIIGKIREGKFKFTPTLCDLFFEFKDYIALVISNISNGIFNDETVEKLYIYFEAEFDMYIVRANSEVKKTILIVEDSTITRYMLKKIINDANYNAITASNGEDGLKKMRSNTIDLLFADMSSHEINSLDMIEELQIEKKYQDLPIVMLINEYTERIKHIGKDIGAKAWLNKPINQKKLLLILDKIL